LRQANDLRLPAERQHLPYELAGAKRALQKPVEVNTRAVAFGDTAERELGVAHDRGQDVVEVVCDAAGHRADGLHLVRVPQVRLELGLLALRALAVGDVGHGADECAVLLRLTRDFREDPRFAVVAFASMLAAYGLSLDEHLLPFRGDARPIVWMHRAQPSVAQGVVFGCAGHAAPAIVDVEGAAVAVGAKQADGSRLGDRLIQLFFDLNTRGLALERQRVRVLQRDADDARRRAEKLEIVGGQHVGRRRDEPAEGVVVGAQLSDRAGLERIEQRGTCALDVVFLGGFRERANRFADCLESREQLGRDTGDAVRVELYAVGAARQPYDRDAALETRRAHEHVEDALNRLARLQPEAAARCHRQERVHLPPRARGGGSHVLDRRLLREGNADGGRKQIDPSVRSAAVDAGQDFGFVSAADALRARRRVPLGAHSGDYVARVLHPAADPRPGHRFDGAADLVDLRPLGFFHLAPSRPAQASTSSTARISSALLNGF
jgi:hypothetical protein